MLRRVQSLVCAAFVLVCTDLAALDFALAALEPVECNTDAHNRLYVRGQEGRDDENSDDVWWCYTMLSSANDNNGQVFSSWMQARAKCKEIDAHLPVIKRKEDFTNLYQLAVSIHDAGKFNQHHSLQLLRKAGFPADPTGALWRAYPIGLTFDVQSYDIEDETCPYDQDRNSPRCQELKEKVKLGWKWLNDDILSFDERDYDNIGSKEPPQKIWPDGFPKQGPTRLFGYIYLGFSFSKLFNGWDPFELTAQFTDWQKAVDVKHVNSRLGEFLLCQRHIKSFDPTTGANFAITDRIKEPQNVYVPPPPTTLPVPTATTKVPTVAKKTSSTRASTTKSTITKTEKPADYSILRYSMIGIAALALLVIVLAVIYVFSEKKRKKKSKNGDGSPRSLSAQKGGEVTGGGDDSTAAAKTTA